MTMTRASFDTYLSVVAVRFETKGYDAALTGWERQTAFEFYTAFNTATNAADYIMQNRDYRTTKDRS